MFTTVFGGKVVCIFNKRSGMDIHSRKNNWVSSSEVTSQSKENNERL
jgi:hypothetical protein